ncbi:MAG: RsmE family RNA methyltransferase [bacterium]|nr:RsmE family RNA methyltransferase [bacterium]
MHERRVFVREPAPDGGTIAVRGGEAHYLLHVLRLRPGGAVTAFDGAGWTGAAVVAGVSRGAATLRIVSSGRAAPPAGRFAVAQAVLKGRAMDAVVRACTELGAASIAGFVAGRSVPRPRGESAGKMLARWRAIAVEACRQCRRDFVPEISCLPDLGALARLARASGRALVASTDPGARPLRELLPVAGTSDILLVVGPEGDFPPEERAALTAAGALACALSDAVLRAETAAAAGAAIIAHHLLPPRA